MNSLAFQITAELLPLIRKIFSNKYSDITSVKIIWHNLIFLTISKVNCLFLSEKHATNISDLVSIGIMPESIKQFEKAYAIFLGTQIDDLADTIYQQKPNLSILRECILSIELCISQTEVNIKEGKSSRDTTGSYYTPYQLAESVVHKALSTKHSKSLLAQKGRTLRIADLSCGGGEFFWAAQQYLEKECCIPYEVSALFFWGMDVDPIALQITICRLLKTSNVADWKEIAGHFLLGNPLISSNTQESLDCKNELFALNRIYASKMGVNYSSIEGLRFDIILGNPPWEKTRFEERKFFSCYEPQISKLAKKDDREQAINELSDTWPELSKWVTELSNDYKVMCSKAYKHPFIKHAVSGELNTYVKDVVANAPATNDIPLVQIETKTAQINDVAEYDISQRLKETFGVEVSGVDIGAIEIDKSSEGYRQLMSVTKDIASAKVQAETTDYVERLRIQREEGQYAMHKQTQSANIGAFQVEKQTEVGIAGAEALGHMGKNGAGGVDLGNGGTGFNPAAMMAGMALGGAVGQNIAGIMNNSMAGVNQTAPSGATPPPVPVVAYHVAMNGQATGPFDLNVLQQMATSGQFNADSLVWKNGMSEWVKAGTIDELKSMFVVMPPIPPVE